MDVWRKCIASSSRLTSGYYLEISITFDALSQHCYQHFSAPHGNGLTGKFRSVDLGRFDLLRTRGEFLGERRGDVCGDAGGVDLGEPPASAHTRAPRICQKAGRETPPLATIDVATAVVLGANTHVRATPCSCKTPMEWARVCRAHK